MFVDGWRWRRCGLVKDLFFLISGHSELHDAMWARRKRDSLMAAVEFVLTRTCSER